MKERTTISLDKDKMDKLDNLAESTGRTRSGLIGFLIDMFRPGKMGSIEFDEDGNEIPKDD